jgi:hypothetical protein
MQIHSDWCVIAQSWQVRVISFQKRARVIMEPSEVSLKLYFVAVDKILGFNIYIFNQLLYI